MGSEDVSHPFHEDTSGAKRHRRNIKGRNVQVAKRPYTHMIQG